MKFWSNRHGRTLPLQRRVNFRNSILFRNFTGEIHTQPSGEKSAATIMHFGIGTALSSTGKLLYSCTVTPNIAVSTVT